MLRFCLALVLGTVLTLWTRDPVPGVLLAAIQTGWNSVATGAWLMRVDSQRSRARCCFVFHVATASWQISAAALTSILCIAATGEFLGAPPDMAKVTATLLVLFGGIVVSTVLGLIATFDSLRHGVKVWIRPRLRLELLEVETDRLLLPPNGPRQRFNYAVFVAATSLVTPPAVLGTILLILTTATGNQDVPLAIALAGLGVTFGGPLLMIAVYIWLSHRIIAANPCECWPEGCFPTAPVQPIAPAQPIATAPAERHQIAYSSRS